MEYKDRLTERIYNEDRNYYYSNEEFSTLCFYLGLYEDMGLSPVELADTLIQGELLKPRLEWDMDKIEKWQSVKSNYYRYLNQE